MQSGEADSELTSRLAESVDKALRNDIWRSEYMKERLIFDDIRREGIAEGIAEGEAKELVNNIQRLMQNVGWSLEQACKSLGKTIEDYKRASEIAGKQ